MNPLLCHCQRSKLPNEVICPVCWNQIPYTVRRAYVKADLEKRMRLIPLLHDFIDTRVSIRGAETPADIDKITEALKERVNATFKKLDIEIP